MPGALESGPALAGLGLTLSELASLCRGVGEAGEGPVSKITVDSRLCGPGAVFVALRGQSRDGHGFIQRALEAGALAAVAGEGYPAGPRIIRVADTLAALGDMARGVRLRSGAKVAAVTGSVGKTTVKEMLRGIFESRHPGGETLVTPGNFNNLIGLPLTLLSLGAGTRVAAVELGASDFGEIERLTRIAVPDAGLVTAAGEGHLEFFGALAGVARAKGELYRNLPPWATAVVNAGDAPMMAEARAFGGRKLYFGLGPPLPMAEGVFVTGRREDGLDGQDVGLHGPGFPGDARVRLRLLGPHNALNAAAAAAVAVALGFGWEDIREGLGRAEAFAGRLRPMRSGAGYYVLDDSYNSNPSSASAALEFLGAMAPGWERCAILGDMLELGAGSRERHGRLGALAARAGLAWLALVGGEAESMAKGAIGAGLPESRVATFGSGAEAAGWMAGRASERSVILVKGSRGVGLETAVGALLGTQTEGGSGRDAV
ncbi:MAG: UDP-N-acetylmuramoyl-tripeptide--D-alanyl-D-alanine ligase [Deltaproteobacteria bacterium]|jgi:UDP-N-acetylmuramoyl-tripeptide--D-alanyl-D-alanine ligase|nr:UDP-N-acetylmuramoyl-tripeptide--D-alanyl-D-alanine ligase [Deltaproteobacteria bacterium]